MSEIQNLSADSSPFHPDSNDEIDDEVGEAQGETETVI